MMEIEREIEKVLEEHSCFGLAAPQLRRHLISDLSRLMERGEPDREALKNVLWNRFARKFDDADNIIGDLMSWATTGSTRKRVDRGKLVDFVYKWVKSTEHGIGFDGLVDKLEALLDGEPSKRWCKEIAWKSPEKYVTQMWVLGESFTVPDDWICCPICSAPRPVEAE